MQYFASHYYLPLVYSEHKNSYINYIIQEESEKNFVKKLIDYVSENEITYKWMFSKMQDRVDKIFIPYLNKNINKESPFFPDFIFWLQKDNKYKILFVDPKGTAHADYQFKIDGFEKIFMENGKPKKFHYDQFEVTFDLKLVGKKASVAKEYQSYWITLEDLRSIFS